MKKKIALITGIAGGLAQLVGYRLYQAGYEIIGVDYRYQPNLSYPATIYRANYNKTKIEDIVRRHRPTHIYHLGRVGNLKERMGKRFDLNVIGSRKVMDLALTYGAERLVVLSTFHIYGAHPHNHIPIDEEDPLRAGAAFPQIADAIQLDTQAVLWVYKNRQCPAVVLRPANIVGPDISNAISTYLRSSPIPYMAGFDPMVQFIHQNDLLDILLKLADHKNVIGVYNVAGKGTIPLKVALDCAEGMKIPIPSFIASSYLKTARLLKKGLPPYLINFLKYPCIISDERLREALKWQPQIAQEEALHSTLHDAHSPEAEARPGAR